MGSWVSNGSSGSSRSQGPEQQLCSSKEASVADEGVTGPEGHRAMVRLGFVAVTRVLF